MLGLLPRSTLIHTHSRSNPEGPNFSATSILARLLEGEAAPGALSEALALSDGDLRAALEQTGGAERRAAAQGLRPAELEEILQLSRERDPQLFFEGLLALGQRLEARDDLEAAARVYTILQHSLAAEASSSASADWRGSLRSRAEGHLQAMRGEGAAGARFEFLSRRLAAQAADPAMLFGMTAAGMAFRLTRVVALSRLLSAPTASVLSRGFLPRALAYSGGVFTESLVFTAGVRAGNAALGRTQDWSLRAVGQEWASGAITLLGLRATGALAHGAVQRLGTGNSLSLGVTRALVPQIGMFGGILLSHRIEARLGLRPHHADGTELTDAFATLLQFNAAGRLSQGLMGSRWAAFERGMDAQAEALSRTSTWLPRFPDIRGGISHLPELAGASVYGSRSTGRKTIAELMSEPSLMSSDPSDPKGPRDFILESPLRTSGEPSGELESIMSRQQLEGLWITLRMNPDPAMRQLLIQTMLDEASRSPEAVQFLATALVAEEGFTGREEVRALITEGFRNMETSTLIEFSKGNTAALRSLVELAKVGNEAAIREIRRMDYSAYAKSASRDIATLMEISGPLYLAFEAGNASAENLLRSLNGEMVEAISQEAQRRVVERMYSNTAKAIQLLAGIGRSGGDNSLQALRMLREFPVEIYEGAEVENPTIQAFYLMAQAGNETAADLLSTIDLPSLTPGTASLLLKLHRYGSETAREDLMSLAGKGDLAAVSVLHDLSLEGDRLAGKFLREMNPSKILSQSANSQGLYTIGLLTQHQNPGAIGAFSASPALGQRLRHLLVADSSSLISVVTPEMLVEQYAGRVSGFSDVPSTSREAICRWIVETWQKSQDKEAYYRDNPTRILTPDLIPISFIDLQAADGLRQYQEAGSNNPPPPRRSETRPSDRPGQPGGKKRFVN